MKFYPMRCHFGALEASADLKTRRKRLKTPGRTGKTSASMFIQDSPAGRGKVKPKQGRGRGLEDR